MCAAYAPRDPIGEFWRGEISLRELRVLVEGLPLDSPLARRDPDRRGWQVSDYLLADLYDAINTLVGLTGARYSGAESFQPPAPRQRPGDEELRAQLRVQSARIIRRVRAIESIVLGKG